MVKNLFFVAVLIIGLVACKSKGVSAYKYNQDIIALERSLTRDITRTEDKVSGYVTTNQYDSIAIAGEEMERIVQKKIDEINAMSVPKAKEAENFKTASLRYFDYIKSLYTSYKKLGKAPTEKERQEEVNDLQKLINKKQSAINEMQSAQRKFAAANDFKVQ